MAVRIKQRWYDKDRQRPPEEKATVVAVAAWKSATHGLQGLRKAKFAVEVGAPFIAVLSEFLAFMVTAADRLAYLAVVPDEDAETRAGPGVDAAWRERFTVALGKRLADLYRENLDELIGPSTEPGGHATALIALINRRMADYAEFGYGEGGPDFAFLRFFGSTIEATMPHADDRKWVLDQVMATQAPEAIETIEKAMRGVLGGVEDASGGRPR